MNLVKYIKFVDSNGKYFIFEFVRGTGEMATYRQGRVVGNKTNFEKMGATPDMPLSFLKLNMYRGFKTDEYATLEDLEGELFLEALEDF
ncbi:MAG: hypothetical protein GY861_25080 [bacterium]|nr:hypothetical protein [bacterium]